MPLSNSFMLNYSFHWLQLPCSTVFRSCNSKLHYLYLFQSHVMPYQLHFVNWINIGEKNWTLSSPISIFHLWSFRCFRAPNCGSNVLHVKSDQVIWIFAPVFYCSAIRCCQWYEQQRWPVQDRSIVSGSWMGAWSRWVPITVSLSAPISLPLAR